MLRTTWLSALVLLFAGMPLRAQPLEDPEELEMQPDPDSAAYRWLEQRRLKCHDEQAEPIEPVELEMGGRTYRWNGPSLKLVSKDSDGIVTLGVLGAIKDFSEDTRAALDEYLAEFSRHKVDAIVLLGDIASIEYELTQVLLLCSRAGPPVLAVIGNTESRAAFNRAVLTALKARPNVINLNFVRTVDLGPAVLVSLPGYRDRRFVHTKAGCTYDKHQVRHTAELVGAAAKPVVLIAHGPPKGSGKRALDFASGAGNVGDPLLREMMDRQKVRFGVFSHILEAGGQAHDRARKPVRQDTPVKSLYLNVGSANPLRWTLNSGKVSCGQAAVVRIRGKTASYTWVRHKCTESP
jgi:Icc-related predicted phosphoesterase